MKIMLIGYSESGKTYFLGSLFKLMTDAGAEGFSVEHKVFHEVSDPEKIYTIIAGERVGTVGSTMMNSENIKSSEWKPAPLVLARHKQQVLDVEVADIEGQAIRPGGNVEVAGALIQVVPEYDGFIVVVEAPTDNKKVSQSKKQLSAALNFVSVVSSKKKGVPVSLILNKIDQLPQASGLKSKIGQKTKEFEDSLIQKGIPVRDIPRMRKSQLGQVINPLVKPLVESVNVYEVIETFFAFMGKDTQSPNMVFPCTSLGFNGDQIATGAKVEDLEPYGTGAAFLWTIYAGLKSQQQQSGILGALKPDKLADELLKDVIELYKSGKAYFDDSDNNLWNSRNIGRLFASQEWGK